MHGRDELGAWAWGPGCLSAWLGVMQSTLLLGLGLIPAGHPLLSRKCSFLARFLLSRAGSAQAGRHRVHYLIGRVTRWGLAAPCSCPHSKLVLCFLWQT